MDITVDRNRHRIGSYSKIEEHSAMVIQLYARSSIDVIAYGLQLCRKVMNLDLQPWWR